MAGYHITAKGEPGKCKAFSPESCPLGNRDEHYDTKAEAQVAFEKTMGSSFAPKEYKDIKIKRRELVDRAASATDPSELMAIAESLNGMPAGRKAARALSTNPAATPEALVTARGKTNLALHEFVELELHPNYPLDSVTGEGVHKMMNNLSTEELNERLKSDDAGDLLIAKTAEYYTFQGGVHKRVEKSIVEEALANPNNKVSFGERARLASEDKDYARAAGKSGHFPDSHSLLKKEYRTTYGRQGKVSDEAIVIASAVASDNNVLREIFRQYKDTPHMTTVAKNIISNPHADDETKRLVAGDLRKVLDELKKLDVEL